MPEVGTKTVEYTFTPDEEQYKSYIGNIAINVTKQTPKLEGMRLVEVSMIHKRHLRRLLLIQVLLP